MGLKYSWILGFSLIAAGAASPAGAMTNANLDVDRGADAVDAQPHMKEALASLGTAKTQLEKASSDKGGHRAKALQYTKLAISEVQKGIKFDNQHAIENWDAVPLEAQPHMRAALATLHTAQRQLEKATADKGGHRVKALAYVEKAIDEAKKAVEFDNQH